MFGLNIEGFMNCFHENGGIKPDYGLSTSPLQKIKIKINNKKK
jgi:hypothetical protein